jgi:hypothetical protein
VREDIETRDLEDWEGRRGIGTAVGVEWGG